MYNSEKLIYYLELLNKINFYDTNAIEELR